jgi:hypothetical protein
MNKREESTYTPGIPEPKLMYVAEEELKQLRKRCEFYREWAEVAMYDRGSVSVENYEYEKERNGYV